MAGARNIEASSAVGPRARRATGDTAETSFTRRGGTRKAIVITAWRAISRVVRSRRSPFSHQVERRSSLPSHHPRSGCGTGIVGRGSEAFGINAIIGAGVSVGAATGGAGDPDTRRTVRFSGLSADGLLAWRFSARSLASSWLKCSWLVASFSTV